MSLCYLERNVSQISAPSCTNAWNGCSLPKPTAVVGFGLHRCLSVCLFVFRTLSQKPMPLGSPNLTHKINVTRWVLETHLFWGRRVKVQGRKSQNHCRLGSLHSCECWLLLDFMALTADRVMFVASSRHDTRWRSQASDDKKIDRVFRHTRRWRHNSVPGRLGQVPTSERQRIPIQETESQLRLLDGRDYSL